MPYNADKLRRGAQRCWWCVAVLAALALISILLRQWVFAVLFVVLAVPFVWLALYQRAELRRHGDA